MVVALLPGLVVPTAGRASSGPRHRRGRAIGAAALRVAFTPVPRLRVAGSMLSRRHSHVVRIVRISRLARSVGRRDVAGEFRLAGAAEVVHGHDAGVRLLDVTDRRALVGGVAVAVAVASATVARTGGDGAGSFEGPVEERLE